METKKKTNAASLLLLLLVSVSCSHKIQMRTPVSRFISPETGGSGWATEATFYNMASTTAEVNFEDEKVDNPLDLTNEYEFKVGVNGNIGITDRLDFVMIFNGQGTTDLYGLKYQLKGPSRANAKKGDESFSIVIGLGSGGETETEGEDLELTAMDDDTKVELTKNARDIGFIYGKRLTHKVLAYAGFNYTTFSFAGKLESQNTNLDGQRLEYAGYTYTTHIGVAQYTGSSGVLKGEFGVQDVHWDHPPAQQFGYISFGVGFHVD